MYLASLDAKLLLVFSCLALPLLEPEPVLEVEWNGTSANERNGCDPMIFSVLFLPALRMTSRPEVTGQMTRRRPEVLENVLSVEDAASMASLIEIVVILWQSIKKALDQNEEAKKYTISKFATVLPEYFRAFKDERCTVALIILASFMPPSAVPTFSCSVLSKLRNLHTGAEENKYATLIDCLCRWGQVSHILELINDWMSETFPEKKDHRRRKVGLLRESPDMAPSPAPYYGSLRRSLKSSSHSLRKKFANRKYLEARYPFPQKDTKEWTDPPEVDPPVSRLAAQTLLSLPDSSTLKDVADRQVERMARSIFEAAGASLAPAFASVWAAKPFWPGPKIYKLASKHPLLSCRTKQFKYQL
ncbi:unnamed protein product [Ranitomeya imitator]|uniref:Uncharacterized protein n=1 Tax=Ranitomeya imitator TaxID=111125 RepID=A0ABN9LTV4_9NEOB|nr:unnamed protein product [Ranitomeya imitator]